MSGNALKSCEACLRNLHRYGRFGKFNRILSRGYVEGIALPITRHYSPLALAVEAPYYPLECNFPLRESVHASA